MCNCNKQKNPCNQCVPQGDCAVKDLSAKCIIVNKDLPCISTSSGETLENVILKIAQTACTEPEGIKLTNVGTGASVYAGIDVLGQKQIKRLLSANPNLSITESDSTITFTATDRYVTGATFNTITGIATFTRTDSTNFTLDLSSLIQVNADYTQETTTAKSFIQNRNPTKTITSNYTLLPSDNNYVIDVNNSGSNITITIPSTGLPTNNYFVGFVQRGTGTVTFSGYNTKPIDLAPVIYGQGHNAAVEIISGNRFLFGSLKAE